MIWQWWRKRRRRQWLQQPFPADWEQWLLANCWQFRELSSDQQQRLRYDVTLLVREKHWEGCGGLQVTAEMQVTIAAQAALMSLGFHASPFDRLLSVLIYPDTFVARPARRQPWGLEEVTAEPRLGEAWYQGPVILSWRQIQEECREPAIGRNVVIHEFAHLLDMANREVDGIPDLPDALANSGWQPAFHEQFERFQRGLRFGRASVLDSYAATSPPEFFAVSSEVFFCRAGALFESLPELYQLLSSYYQQDPRAWSEK